tara:strand:+ start:6810 stop:7499 length:690 start_codon:yes stop_codon:yes gene_type:complete
MSKLRVKEIAHSNGTGAMSVNSSGVTTFDNLPVGVGFTHIKTVTVASGSAAANSIDFENVFSSTYRFYMMFYHIYRAADSSTNGLGAQMKSGSSVITSGNYRGVNAYDQLNSSSGSGKQYYYSDEGILQFGGTLGTTTDGGFVGTLKIINPYSSTFPVSFISEHVMHQAAGADGSKWLEQGACSGDFSDAASRDGFILHILTCDASGGDVSASTTKAAVYGEASLYGVA